MCGSPQSSHKIRQRIYLVIQTKIHVFERRKVTSYTTILRRQAGVGVCVGENR